MSSDATAQVLALITSIFYASALVSARAGMRYSTPTTVTGLDSHTEPPLVVSHICDGWNPPGTAYRYPAVHCCWNISARRSVARLYGCRKDRRVAQQRAAVREPADQRGDRGGDARRADDAADCARYLSRCRRHRINFVET